jgi:hypothetical protein
MKRGAGSESVTRAGPGVIVWLPIGPSVLSAPGEVKRMSRMILAAVLMLFPQVAAAQFAVLENLFKNFTDVNLYWINGGFANRPPALTGGGAGDPAKAWGLNGLGFEASFQVGEYWPKTRPPERKRCDSACVDTVSIKVQGSKEPPTTYTLTPKKRTGCEDCRLSAGLAVGYSEVRGFESILPGVDIRGSLRELPAISLYVTYLTEGRVAPYFGVRTGLAQLNNFRAYVSTDGASDQTFGAGATTFELGLALGGILDVGAVTLFAEPSFTYRKFSSLDWSNINGNVADALPRSLDFSTYNILLGAQVELGIPSSGK